MGTQAKRLKAQNSRVEARPKGEKWVDVSTASMRRGLKGPMSSRTQINDRQRHIEDYTEEGLQRARGRPIRTETPSEEKRNSSLLLQRRREPLNFAHYDLHDT